jgi:hypothetical protein
MSQDGRHTEAAELYQALLDQVKKEAYRDAGGNAKASRWLLGVFGSLVLLLVPMVISGLITAGALKDQVNQLQGQVSYLQTRIDHLQDMEQKGK